MTNEHLENFMLMFTESHILEKIDDDEIINELCTRSSEMDSFLFNYVFLLETLLLKKSM